MKIEKSCKVVKFSSLERGEVFYMASNVMSDGSPCFMVVDRDTGYTFNAVNLSSGLLTSFYGDDDVVKVNAKVVVSL